MLDIKKKLVLISVLLFSLPVQASVIGCMDDEGYTKIYSAKIEKENQTIIIRLKVDDPHGIDITQKRVKGTLKVRLYGSYITQDVIQLSPSVQLLEYTGFTMLNIVGGKKILYQKVEGGNDLLIFVQI